jgi:hypothetical protein
MLNEEFGPHAWNLAAFVVALLEAKHGAFP